MFTLKATLVHFKQEMQTGNYLDQVMHCIKAIIELVYNYKSNSM